MRSKQREMKVMRRILKRAGVPGRGKPTPLPPGLRLRPCTWTFVVVVPTHAIFPEMRII